MNSQTVNSGYVVEADLTGSRVFPEAYSVRLWGDWPGWSPDEIRLRCAEHYGVPVEQIAQPALMTKEEFDANSEVPLNVSRPHERQDENDSLYRYIRDTTESVRRGPWYLPPSFMLREQEADDEQR